MRVFAWFVVFSMVVWSGFLSGCANTAGDCQLTAECSGGPGATTSSASTSSTTTSSTTTPPGCSPSESSEPPDETCGVFVSASAEPDGDGTPEKPFATLAKALEVASGTSARRVYACAETFAEAIILPAELGLFGGLDCANGWTYSVAGRTTVAPSVGVPITFEPGNTTHVENVKALAPDGTQADPASKNPRSGGASIAMLAKPDSKIDLVRCDLEAGNGAAGVDGQGLPAQPEAPHGATGAAACTIGFGGVAPLNKCPEPTTGGNGGDGGPMGTPQGSVGLAGNGTAAPGKGGNPQIDASACGVGGSGEAGQSGTAGKGGKLADVLLDDERKGAPGSKGEAGRTGAGGGGGGGGKGCTMGPGAGGGSGGAGGCGGVAGEGGGAGGSSIALWAEGAGVTLTGVKLTTKSGGKGGAGANGQEGGNGGPGGDAGSSLDGSSACNGGSGGKGGAGGPGGGGQGGHSIAIVFTTFAPKLVATEFELGLPGMGENGGVGGENGDEGLGCSQFNTDGLLCD